MTTRADRIETAARALWSTFRDDDWSDAQPWDRDACRDSATAVLDAVLPQITTAEQLEALPAWSVVLDSDGQPWTRLPDPDEGWQHLACGPISARVVLAYRAGPLTVVWQPQPDQEQP